MTSNLSKRKHNLPMQLMLTKKTRLWLREMWRLRLLHEMERRFYSTTSSLTTAWHARTNMTRFRFTTQSGEMELSFRKKNSKQSWTPTNSEWLNYCFQKGARSCWITYFGDTVVLSL